MLVVKVAHHAGDGGQVRKTRTAIGENGSGQRFKN